MSLLLHPPRGAARRGTASHEENAWLGGADTRGKEERARKGKEKAAAGCEEAGEEAAG